MARFEITIQTSDTNPALVSVEGDVEAEGWERELVSGLVELLELIGGMHGKEVVENGLKGLFK